MSGSNTALPIPPKFKQICIGQFGNSGSNSFAVIALSEDGEVWQFRSGRWQRIEEISRNQRSSAAPEEPGW